MDVRDILTQIQRKWKGGSNADTKFNNFVIGAINQAVEKITTHMDYWFLERTAAITTVASQRNYKIGNPKPTTSPGVADSGSGGNPDGKYRYKVAYVNAFGDSNPGPASETITVATNQVSLTSIPTADAIQLVTARKIYRTKALGNADDGTYYLLATISDNTTLTYTDNIADASLTSRMPYQHEIKMLNYWYQTTSPAYINKIKRSTFRKLRPDATGDTGKPVYGYVVNDEMNLYPLADAAYTITYPYTIRWKRLEYDSDDLPDEIPFSLIFDYVESEVLMFLNKENRFWQEAITKYQAGLNALDDQHIKNKPAIEIISEDADVSNFNALFPEQSYYNE